MGRGRLRRHPSAVFWSWVYERTTTLDHALAKRSDTPCEYDGFLRRFGIGRSIGNGVVGESPARSSDSGIRL